VEAAKKNPDIWFLFLNTCEFRGVAGLPNIVFLPATADPILKRRFLNTCDAMLHGRQRGETFGLSCLEFAMLGKPVLTYANSPERAHLEILGDAAVAYENAQHLRALLRDRGRWSDIGSLGAEDGGQRAECGGQRTDVGGRLSVVGSRKSVVSGRRSEAHQQPTTNNQQRIRSHKAFDSRFSQYQPEAVMQKFQQVFLQ
jgi:glycosyltransferase involved in cell wall biosynthesis